MRSVLVAVCACLVAGPATAADPTVYGKGVQVGETVTIADLLAKPEKFVDQIVRVEGVVTDVRLGEESWIEITDQDGSRNIRFEVEGAEIVFPLSVKGKHTVAEGRFRKLTLTREQAVARARLEAQARGETFEPGTAPFPVVVYSIEGFGAIVHENGDGS